MTNTKKPDDNKKLYYIAGIVFIVIILFLIGYNNSKPVVKEVAVQPVESIAIETDR